MRKDYDFSKGIRNRFAGRQLKIECAPIEEIRFLAPIAREFFANVFEMDYDECLVTDESCVMDFVMDDAAVQRAKERYGIELKHEKLVEVLRRVNR